MATHSSWRLCRQRHQLGFSATPRPEVVRESATRIATHARFHTHEYESRQRGDAVVTSSLRSKFKSYSGCLRRPSRSPNQESWRVHLSEHAHWHTSRERRKNLPVLTVYTMMMSMIESVLVVVGSGVSYPTRSPWRTESRTQAPAKSGAASAEAVYQRYC